MELFNLDQYTVEPEETPPPSKPDSQKPKTGELWYNPRKQIKGKVLRPYGQGGAEIRWDDGHQRIYTKLELHTLFDKYYPTAQDRRFKVGDRVINPKMKAAGVITEVKEGISVRWGSREQPIYYRPSRLVDIEKAEDNERWLDQYFASSTSVRASVPDSPSLPLPSTPPPNQSQIDLDLSDSVSETVNTAKKSSDSDTPVSQSTQTSNDSRTSKQSKPTSSPPRPPVNLSAFRENGKGQGTPGICFSGSWNLSDKSNPNTSPLRTFKDSYLVPTNQGTTQNIFHIYSDNLPSSGMMQNGCVSEVDTLALPSLDDGCFWLESPTALSSVDSSPPGWSKLEAQLQKLGLLSKGQVLNPEWLELSFALPAGWSDLSELSPARGMLDADDPLSEIASTLAQHFSPSIESSTSTPTPEDLAEIILKGEPEKVWGLTRKLDKSDRVVVAKSLEKILDEQLEFTPDTQKPLNPGDKILMPQSWGRVIPETEPDLRGYITVELYRYISNTPIIETYHPAHLKAFNFQVIRVGDKSLLGKHFFSDRYTVVGTCVQEFVEINGEYFRSNRGIKLKCWWKKKGVGEYFWEHLDDLDEIAQFSSPLPPPRTTSEDLYRPHPEDLEIDQSDRVKSLEKYPALVFTRSGLAEKYGLTNLEESERLYNESRKSREKSHEKESDPPRKRKRRQTGSLYQYTKLVENKEGIRKEYPPVADDEERDRANDKHWYWGYSYIETYRKCDRHDKSYPVSRKILPLVRRATLARFDYLVTLDICKLKPKWFEFVEWAAIGETQLRGFVISFRDKSLYLAPLDLPQTFDWKYIREDILSERSWDEIISNFR